MSPLDIVTTALLAMGAFFFLAGTVGMLRFPDTLSRLHALTKADTLGLGSIVAALVLQAPSVPVLLKLVGIWLLVLLASSSVCYLIGRYVQAKREDDDDPG